MPFQSKRQRAAIRRQAREQAVAAEVSIAESRPSVGVEQRRGGVGIIVNKNNNDSPSRADTARARIRETTTVQNLQSRVRDLRRKVVSSNEAERYGKYCQQQWE
uniref:Uncharacterized protein n=1 Tax=Tetraselmis chuii TaxID=63592 RepID=A0A7S1SR42_9CHLO|mmetsp:Transcript_23637/g.42000  ORF Transcript_23637/g.42000 Transcript_23637/m.42000 type:complete len:104 (+) Transcript_23637:385-696(+)